jgi:hypothetical protein
MSLDSIVLKARRVISMPYVHKVQWAVRTRFHKVKRLILVKQPIIKAGPILKEIITKNVPYASGKMGSVEVSGLTTYLKRVKARSQGSQVPAYSRFLSPKMHVNAGIFPKADEEYDRFGAVYLDAVQNCDMLASWDVAGEAQILGKYCKTATLVDTISLHYPFFISDPWSSALEGKRVLVISPFVDTIRKQYDRFETLWDDPHVLPLFELLTLRVPLSAGLVTPLDMDWSSALSRLKNEMSQLDYDVALIGAGAFSLPLVVHAKNAGRIGIHLGGPLQILFGILGGRWTWNPDFKPFIKSTWVRPSEDETPKTASLVESGCYW